jgi:DNA repair photolyase
MKIWKEVPLKTDCGEIKMAISPLIISASRSTDIPAFHSDWLISRLKSGYACWMNPFRPANPTYISFQEARLFVFWSKNPRPMIQHLSFLDQLGLNYYFQYTLNDYEKEGFEPNVPPLENRIATFIQLSDLIGKEKVIWRFDPLLLTGQLTVKELLRRIREIGNQLVSHTDQLVFSFADILSYHKVQSNLIKETTLFDKSNIKLAEFNNSQKHEFAAGIQQILQDWILINPDFKIATCAEDIDLERYQIIHNKCIDDELIVQLFSNDSKLMGFLGAKAKEPVLFDEDVRTRKPGIKDKGQRKACNCIVSKDIGAYNTCHHLCVYCYANASPEIVRENLKELRTDSESILPIRGNTNQS